MSVSASTIQEIFQDLGLFVRQATMYGSDVPALIAAESVMKRSQLDDGDERLETLGRAVAQDAQNTQLIEALVDGEVQVVETYLLDHVKPTIQAAGASGAEVLADLAEQMIENCTPAQYVLRNEVALDGSVAADSDNSGNGTLGSVATSQYLAAQRFTVECVDAGTVGSEVWSVTGSVSGTLDNATTGVAYTDSNAYLQFTITAGGVDFAVGDKFYFYLSCTERRFQTFLRDQFGVVMPSVATGSETIEEAWAE